MSASDWRHWFAATLITGALGCALNPAPDGWLEPAREAVDDPYGAWIVVAYAGGGTSGEFLAVDRDSVFVLLSSGRVQGAPLDSVTRARVAYYDARQGSLAIWTAMGSASTISNGAFLIFTLPTWIIGGSLATASQSRAPLIAVDTGEGNESRAESWDAVRMYARFPSGLPPDLPRTLPTRPRY